MAPEAPSRAAIREDKKVVVHFRHAGNAPILKQSKFKLPADIRFHVVTEVFLVRRCQIFKGGHNAIKATSRGSNVARLVNTGCNKHRIMLSPNVFKTCFATHIHIEVKMDTAVTK